MDKRQEKQREGQIYRQISFYVRLSQEGIRRKDFKGGYIELLIMHLIRKTI